MPAHIALLRSMVINRQRLTSAKARLMAEQVGATDIVTIGATGNLLFRSRKAPARLEGELEAACARIYGRATEVVVKSGEAWRALVAANPFPHEAARAPARLLVWAMRSPLPDAGLAQLVRRARGEERVVRTASGDIYTWFGEGPIHESKLTAGFGLKALGAVGTNRNWNTVMKITDALGALEGL
jgi:uncharacterized protein (DUF1697 family)